MNMADRLSEYRWLPVSEEIAPPEAPYFCPVINQWRISRYDDIRALLRSREAKTEDPTGRVSSACGRLGVEADRLCRFAAGNIVFQEGPPHLRQKKAFLEYIPRLEKRWDEGRLRSLVKRHLAALPQEGAVDLCPALSNAVMTEIAADSLGLPVDLTAEVVHKGSTCWEAFFYPMRRSQYAAYEDGLEIVFEALKDRVRGETFLPVGDVQADGLRDEETFLIAAIWATSTTFLNHCLYYLSQANSLQDCLAAEPARRDLFLQEVLRLNPSTPSLASRVMLEPVILGGVEIPAGDRVMSEIQRSGRDETVYPDAEQIWLDERRPANFGFSFGQHVCLGQNFARRVASAVLSEILSTFRISYVSSQKSDFRTATLFQSMVADMERVSSH